MIDELRRILWPKGHRLDIWAIVDAAQDQQVYWTLTNSFLPHCCLFAGALPPALEMAAPYLVRLDPDDKFTAYLAKNLSRNLAIFLQCDASLPEVRRHLRSFLTVKDASGRKMLFRYYDPRVLRVYLPTCSSNELETVFGPLQTFWAVTENSRELTQFVFRGKNLQVSAQRLQTGEGEFAAGEPGPVIVLAQRVLAVQRGGARQRVPVLLQGAGRGGVLRRSSAAVRFFRSVSAPEELPFRDSTYSIPVSDLDPDVTLYAEAEDAGDVTLTLDLTGGGRAEATVQCVRLTLDGGGGFVCVGASPDTRRRVDVLPVEPASFRGQLTLRSSPALSNLTLFTVRDSDFGHSLADGFRFDAPREPVSFWLEAAPGNVGSEGELCLTVEGSHQTGDSMPVTVAKLEPLTAAISGIPPRTRRIPAAENEICLRGESVVLLAGAGDMIVRAETVPAGLPLQWSVSRLDEDSEAIRALSANPLPTLQPVQGGAVMRGDAAGTFAVQATTAASDEWGGPLASMEVSLVHASLVENRSSVNGRFCHCGRTAGSDTFGLHSGTAPAVRLEAAVALTGGGPDGRRGVDAIRGAWIVNLIVDNTGARYRGGVTRRRVYSYQSGESRSQVDLEDGPLLEGLPEGKSAEGGQLTVEHQAAPGVSWQVQDGGPIEQIWSYQECRCYLALWSIHAPLQIGVLLQTGWVFTGDYSCNPLKLLRTTVPVRLAAAGTVVYPAVVPGSRTELEVHPPTAEHRGTE